jgi:hypothetical protein
MATGGDDSEVVTVKESDLSSAKLTDVGDVNSRTDPLAALSGPGWRASA